MTDKRQCELRHMDLFGASQEKSKKKKSENPQESFNPSVSQSPNAPLALRMRPRSLEEFIGQNHLLGEGKLLR